MRGTGRQSCPVALAQTELCRCRIRCMPTHRNVELHFGLLPGTEKAESAKKILALEPSQVYCCAVCEQVQGYVVLSQLKRLLRRAKATLVKRKR